MLLDQSSSQLLRTHFLGRDGFVWWIGQIALPATSKWDSSDLKNKKQGVELYYNRVKVRIFGYHTGNCSDLPDEQLPWAHILVPPGESNGVSKQGKAHNYQGGETVIGFFLDGDDAQQPVIFGSLYKSSEIKSIKIDDIQEKLCSNFAPFDPNPVRFHNSLSPKDPGGQNVGTGKGDVNSKGTAAKGNSSGIDNVTALNNETTPAALINFTDKLDNKTTKPSICNNNSFTAITAAIEKLLKKIENYQNIANAYYYDKIRNKVTNFTGEIRKISILISGDVTEYIKMGMNYLFEELSKKLGLTFGGLFPKTKQSQIGKTIDKILEAIYCAFKKIGFDLFGIIDDALNKFIGNAIGATVCVIQNFLGQLLSKILSTIESTILPLLDSLNSLVQGALGSVANLLSGAMNLLGLIQGLLSCADPSKYCDTPQTFSSVEANALGIVADVEGLIANAGNIGGLVGNIGDSISSFGDLDLNANGCNATSRTCGPPEIVILGGEGSGAKANAVVNDNGQVIGAIVTDTGSGYVEPPAVSIIDGCGNGTGAKAKAILGIGSPSGVEKIVIIDPGDGYLNNENTETYGDDRIGITTTPSNTDTQGSSYTGIVSDVAIINPGYGYGEDTTITIGDCKTNIELGPAGIITKVTVENGCYVNELPPVTINSITGAAANIKPILSFTQVGIGSTAGVPIKVIDCVQK